MTLLERVRAEEQRLRRLSGSLAGIADSLASIAEDAERCGDERIEAQRAALPATADTESTR